MHALVPSNSLLPGESHKAASTAEFALVGELHTVTLLLEHAGAHISCRELPQTPTTRRQADKADDILIRLPLDSA